MGYATVPSHVAGDTFPSADWMVVANNLNNGGVMRMLADTTLIASAASIDFTSIPQTFAHLMIRLYPRTDEAAVFSTVIARLNNDSGANYDWEKFSATAAAVSCSESLAATSMFASWCPGNTAPANAFGAITLDIPHYTNALNHKSLIASGAHKQGIATGQITALGAVGFWRAVAAVNRVTLSSGGNFVAGTRATLYGLPL